MFSDFDIDLSADQPDELHELQRLFLMETAECPATP